MPTGCSFNSVEEDCLKICHIYYPHCAEAVIFSRKRRERDFAVVSWKSWKCVTVLNMHRFHAYYINNIIVFPTRIDNCLLLQLLLITLQSRHPL